MKEQYKKESPILSMLGMGGGGSGIALGGASEALYGADGIFTEPGIYPFIVPSGVFSICVVCVGGGANAGYGDNRRGGGGGALAYVNNISVTPGETLTVESGRSGGYADGSFIAAGHSALKRANGTILCRANGGQDGNTGTYGSGTRGGYG